MQTEHMILIAGFAVNFATLILLLLQTRHLATQTKALSTGLRYTSYQKLVDYTNDVSMLLLENERVVEVFKEMDFVKDGTRRGLSVEKIGLAWLIINRFEAAFVGHELGIISDDEWKVWTKRLKKDLQIPFIREVWRSDVGNFEYNTRFKDLINELL